MKPIMPILAVNDIERSIAFYRDVLEFNLDFTMPGDDGRVIHASLSRGDACVTFGPWDRTSGVDPACRGAGVVHYFTAEDDVDIDEYFVRAVAGGASVFQEPTNQFWGHRDWGITDPDGYQLIMSKIVKQVSIEDIVNAGLVGAPAD
jgi:uncharacterized glyoxalase superfamily protein PhnB